MTNHASPYAAVIADLKRRREKIDQAIKALEELGGTQVNGESAPAPENGGSEAPEGAFLGMTIPDATKRLLQLKKKTLSNGEIVKLLEAGGLHLTSENKTNTVGSVLNRRARTQGDIVSPKRGQWGLKEWYPGRNFGRKGGDESDAEKGEDEQPEKAADADVDELMS